MPTMNDECKCCKLIGVLSEVEALEGSLAPTDECLVGEIYIPQGLDFEIYDGEYYVIPAPFNEQVLLTNNKLMEDDVTVAAIPYFETSNLSGGYTVFIGGD